MFGGAPCPPFSRPTVGRHGAHDRVCQPTGRARHLAAGGGPPPRPPPGAGPAAIVAASALVRTSTIGTPTTTSATVGPIVPDPRMTASAPANTSRAGDIRTVTGGAARAG